MRSEAEKEQPAAPHAQLQPGAAGTLSRDAAWEDSVLRHARAAHERGALADAEGGYLELLGANPRHAEALHMLGVLRFQEGNLQDAETLIRQSIEWKPAPLSLANYAAVVAGLGRREEALGRLEEALALNPVHPRALLQRAGILAELQRHEEAVAAYDRLLAVAPAFVDGLCRRSASLRAMGRLEEAHASCDRALTIDGRSFGALAEHGHVLRALGHHEDAVTSFGRALAVAPGNAAVLFVRGMSFLELERPELALSNFNEALASAPDFTDALYNSAVVLERLGRNEDALARCNRVIALDPQHARAHANRGNVLHNLGRIAESAASYEKALELEPDSIEVLCNQTNTLRRLDRREAALQSAERALAIDPGFLAAWFARGRVLQGLHRYEDALASFDKVLAATPENPFAQFHRGNMLMTLRRHDEAAAAFGRAIEIDPDYVNAHCNLAFLCLSIGDFGPGWKEYEWRWKDPQMFGDLPKFAQPRWTGEESLDGKVILLGAEQGLGDTLQFCRYIPLVKALGARVVLEAQPELRSVLATLDGVDEFVDRKRGAVLPPFDVHCTLLSLPLALGTELATIPCDVPYLHADPERVARWRDKLGTPTRPRIGLVWSGNPRHLNDRNRSISLASLLPLMSDAFEWISLQKVVREEDEPILASSALRHFGDELGDFADTAALLETVDCVLSVDTSVAHLAGALGRPLWVMLPHTPDFRWLLDREDNPWYPQARLFRQSKPGDWTDVFERVGHALTSVRAATGVATFA